MNYHPLKQSERIEVIDALRGFALLGILMVNMLIMYQPLSAMMIGAQADAGTLHILSESFIKVFFEGKFYVIFSMLFGFGFFIFLNKPTENGSALPVFRWRLLYLLLFGVAHITFIWAGDVLLYYALFGFLLILFRKSSDKKIKRWAIAMAFIPTILTLIMVGFVSLASLDPQATAEMEMSFETQEAMWTNLFERASLAYSSGSFQEIMMIRLEEYIMVASGALFIFCPVILAMFLIGYLVARKGIITNYKNNLPLFRKSFWWGLAIGLPASVIYAIAYRYAKVNEPDLWSLVATTMHIFGGIFLGVSYMSGLVILAIKGKAGWLQKALVPIGRMALTNYLLQSIISAFLFHSYGLALFGKVQVWQGILLAIVIFILQIGFSRWWLKRFRFGPFEWLWRSLTYREWQSMRKA